MAMHHTTRNLLVSFASAYNAHISNLGGDKPTPMDLSGVGEKELKLLDIALAHVVAIGINSHPSYGMGSGLYWPECMLSTAPEGDLYDRVNELISDLYNTEWPEQ